MQVAWNILFSNQTFSIYIPFWLHVCFFSLQVMKRYISNPDNLKLMMIMLKEKSRNIQFEAFHVFKVFVANPDKPRPILEILLRNQDKLVEFLTRFHTDRSEDEQFNDEKAYLIKQIKELKPLPPDQ